MGRVVNMQKRLEHREGGLECLQKKGKKKEKKGKGGFGPQYKGTLNQRWERWILST